MPQALRFRIDCVSMTLHYGDHGMCAFFFSLITEEGEEGKGEGFTFKMNAVYLLFATF